MDDAERTMPSEDLDRVWHAALDATMRGPIRVAEDVLMTDGGVQDLPAVGNR